MTGISSISAYTPTSQTQAVGASDPDQDGDNDAGKSAAAEAGESRGPATTVTLSPQAQALLASQKSS